MSSPSIPGPDTTNCVLVIVAKIATREQTEHKDNAQSFVSPCLVYSFIPIHLLLHSPGRRGGSGGEMRGGRGEVMSFSFRILVSCSRRVCCCCAVLKLVAFKCSCRWFYLATKPHFSWSPEDIRQRTPIKQEKAQTGTRRGAAGSVVMTRRHFTLWTISFMLYCCSCSLPDEMSEEEEELGGRKAHLLSFVVIKIQSSCSRNSPTAGKYVVRRT